nr:MAG TPA: SOS-response transcriptional repressor [Caudoviricetes sp.]
MYEIFEKLCNERGITPYKFCKDNNVRTSTISTWKKKNSTVGTVLAKKICDYFEISMDYLMTGKDAIMVQEPQIKPISERDIAKKIDEIIGDINATEETPLYYNGVKIDSKSLAVLLVNLKNAKEQMEIMQDKSKK